MKLVQHRINTMAGLRTVDPCHGAEVDVRYHCDDLVLHHDPYGHHRETPELLESWLAEWRHDGPLILNVKTEGVERECIAMMRRHRVREWFFLDLSPPYLVRYGLLAQAGRIEGFGPRNIAVRVSEYEPVDMALGFAGRAGWIWADCFTRMPLDHAAAARLRSAGFRICVVSPELQKHDPGRIAEFRHQLAGIAPDAVCTKHPGSWVDDPVSAEHTV